RPTAATSITWRPCPCRGHHRRTNLKTMRNRSMNHRLLSTIGLGLLVLGTHAQTTATGAAASAPAPPLMWILAGIACMQVIIIMALSGAMRNLAGLGRWAIKQNGARLLVALPLTLWAAGAHAQ